MDKSCEESSATNPNPNQNPGGGANDLYLKQLHKLSHKISKPPIRKPFEFDHQFAQNRPPLVLDDQNQPQPSNLHPPPPLPPPQHQPPVYNVSRSDFRDVVQKLTGSPAHERVAIPAQSKPQTSRLHRIRPPPLEHVGNRPPPLMNGGVLGNPNPRPAAVPGNFFGSQRQPLSPLPPLPAVHATAESPISAYLRCFQNSFTQPPPPPLNTAAPPPSPTPVSLPPMNFPAPSSPLPFGCLASPKSQYPLPSPGFPFSPTNQFGFQQFTPLSPTLPVPSPKWKSV